MPVDITALVILVVAILPGIAGEAIYRIFIGVLSWRDTAINNTLRLLSFSLGGATVYALAATLLKLPPPNHLFPSELRQFGPTNYGDFFVPYAGHILGSVVVGFAVIGFIKMFADATASLTKQTAWDEFVHIHVLSRWVVVSLKSGDTYAGKLKVVENRVKSDERDVVLEEPALYSKEQKNYIAVNYQFLYLPAETIVAIGAITNPGDQRTLIVGSKLYEE